MKRSSKKRFSSYKSIYSFVIKTTNQLKKGEEFQIPLEAVLTEIRDLFKRKLEDSFLTVYLNKTLKLQVSTKSPYKFFSNI